MLKQREAGSRQHDIDGGADAGHIQVDMRTVHAAVGIGDDAAGLGGHIRAQRLKALEMLVDGADAQVAAAGHADLRGAEPAQKRPDEVIGSPVLSGEVVVQHLGGAKTRAVDADGGIREHLHLRAQPPKDLQLNGDVADLGQIFDDTGPFYENGAGQNGHCRILCAADGHLTVQSAPALDDVFGHRIVSFRRRDVHAV